MHTGIGTCIQNHACLQRRVQGRVLRQRRGRVQGQGQARVAAAQYAAASELDSGSKLDRHFAPDVEFKPAIRKGEEHLRLDQVRSSRLLSRLLLGDDISRVMRLLLVSRLHFNLTNLTRSPVHVPAGPGDPDPACPEYYLRPTERIDRPRTPLHVGRLLDR